MHWNYIVLKKTNPETFKTKDTPRNHDLEKIHLHCFDKETLRSIERVLILLMFLTFVHQSLGQDFLFIGFAKMFPHVPFQDTVSKYKRN